MGTLLQTLLQKEPRGQEPILFAGQKEAQARLERLAKGIPISDDLLHELTLAAPYLTKLGLGNRGTADTSPGALP